MSCMDKFPEMKGFYVIMDDESIHTSNKVQNMIKKKENMDVFTVLLIPLN